MKRLLAILVGAFALVLPSAALAHTASLSYNCNVLTIGIAHFGTNNAGTQRQAKVNVKIDGGSTTQTVISWFGDGAVRTVSIGSPNDGLTHDVEVDLLWGNQSGTFNDTNANGHTGSESMEFEAVACAKDGQPGLPGVGEPGADGEPGTDGEPGANGKDGSDGGSYVGAAGQPGSAGLDGIDGLSADLCPNLKGVQQSAPARKFLSVNSRGQLVCVAKPYIAKARVIVKRVMVTK